MQFCQSLLAFVPLKLAPELQILIDHFQRFLVITRQFDLFPEAGWEV
jgi:hypothetical protein